MGLKTLNAPSLIYWKWADLCAATFLARQLSQRTRRLELMATYPGAHQGAVSSVASIPPVALRPVAQRVINQPSVSQRNSVPSVSSACCSKSCHVVRWQPKRPERTTGAPGMPLCHIAIFR